MKSRFLFQHQWRNVGYVLFIVGLLFYILTWWSGSQFLVWHNLRSFESQGFTGPSVNECFDDEIQFLLIIAGLVFIAFSKEVIEDEHIVQLRLESLQWAIYVNYAIFIICLFAVYGINFFSVIIYNVVTPLVIFIVRFRYLMYRETKNGVELT